MAKRDFSNSASLPVLLHHEPFPNRKSHLIDDPIEWLEYKVTIDRVVNGLWRIHGKAYDFSSFAAQHPGTCPFPFVSTIPQHACFHSVLTDRLGGRHWIDMTKGQDITDLFEVHHLNLDKASSILPKYFFKVSRKP